MGKFRTYDVNNKEIDIDLRVAINENIHKYTFSKGNLNFDGCRCLLGVILDLDGTDIPDRKIIKEKLDRVDTYSEGMKLHDQYISGWKRVSELLGPHYDIYSACDAMNSFQPGIRYLNSLPL